MNTTGKFTACPKSLEGFFTIVNEDTGLIVDFDSAHGEMEDWFHEGDMEFIVHFKGVVLKELFTKRVFLFTRSVGIIFFECVFESRGGNAHFLGKISTRFKMAHQSAT